MSKKKPDNYVNNAEFLAQLIEYKEKCLIAEQNNTPRPEIPRKIGEAIIQIANRLSTRFNFQNYTFREEMVGDGILNAIEAVSKFNPEKSSNPFAYFTQIIYRAFIRRIDKEKVERTTRDKLMFDVTTILFDGDTEVNINSDDVLMFMNS